MHLRIDFLMVGVLGYTPKILWTDCPHEESCDKCLDVAFESRGDLFYNGKALNAKNKSI